MDSPKRTKITLDQAVGNVRNFFKEVCGGILVTFQVMEATEDFKAGMYVIRCKERCFVEPDIRTHVVWVNSETGELVNTKLERVERVV